MPLTRFSADAFAVVTIALVSLLILLGLFCVYQSLYIQIRILRQDLVQLVYFNGPWVTRIALVLVAIWWGIWEILRLTLLKEKLRIFSSVSWQKNVCKFYILSNFGFAEPSMFLTLIFLLHASLPKRELDALSQRWNRKAILYILVFSLPILVMQISLVSVGPKLTEKMSRRTKMAKYFTNTSSAVEGSSIAFEAIVFLAFCMLFFSAVVGIYMLVHWPVADSLSLRNLGHIEIQEMPYDDYYHDGAPLLANQSYLGTGSLVDTERNSVSFRTMIRDEPSPMSEGVEEAGYYPVVLQLASPSGSAEQLSASPMLPYREIQTS